MNHRREVDGLRALAVLPVILFHAGIESFNGGYVGVDIFLVISGYLITGIIISELNSNSFSITNFYERRARRILPALFLVMSFCFAASCLWLSPAEMEEFSQSLIAVTTFSSNIYFWKTDDYFGAAAELKPLLHTWSLALEEQYYLIFPILLAAIWRTGRSVTLAILLVVFICSFVLAQHKVHENPTATFYLLPTRAWELLLGSFAAIYLSRAKREQSPVWLGEIGGMTGIALICAAIFLYDKTTPFPGPHALTPTLGAILVIVFATQSTLAGRLLGSPILVGIGLISYSAYLWHQPLFAFARQMSMATPSESILLLYALLSLLTGYVSWRFVEAPFRNKNFIGRRSIFALSAVTSGLFIALGLAGHFGVIDSLRYDEAERNAFKDLNQKPHCIQSFSDEIPRECVVGDRDASTLIVALGDSHLAQWADALDFIGRKNGVRIEIYAKAACANSSVEYHYALLKRQYSECSIWRNNATKEIIAKKPALVFLTNSSAGYVKNDGTYPTVSDWKAGVDDLLNKLTSSGIRFAWLADNPRFENTRPLNCYKRHLLSEKRNADECGVPVGEVLDETIRRVEKSSVSAHAGIWLDFSDYYCDSAFCYLIREDTPIMRDSNHLTATAVDRLKLRLETEVVLALRSSE